MDVLLTLARYKKFLVTVANLLVVVAGLGVLDGKALAIVLGATAVLNALGVKQLANAKPADDDYSVDYDEDDPETDLSGKPLNVAADPSRPLPTAASV